MAAQSYERSYQTIVDAQVLAELEEIVTFKKYPSKRDWLIETWWRRLQGCERSFEHWHRLLLVRSIVLPKENDVKPWLKFSNLCQKTGNLNLSYHILKSLKEQFKNNADKSTEYELTQYSFLKYLHANGSKNEAFTKLKELVENNLLVQYNNIQTNIALINTSAQQQNPQLITQIQMFNKRDLQKRRLELDQQLSKCYLKLGKWQNDLEGFRETTIETMIKYYKESKDHNQLSYKAWQAWAYANYKAIKFYKNSIERRNVYIKPAIQGFFSCIRLTSSSQEASCLQDTLSLLTIWFDYCNSADVYEALNEGIKYTPIEIWLQVIPQLIARIDSNKQLVSTLIFNLLTNVGKVHPQALVYRLILASKCTNKNIKHYSGSGSLSNGNELTNSARNAAATRILLILRESNNTLVEQAKLVSEELIKVAILWHEMWHEGLEEASKQYFSEKNINAMFETLDALHQIIDNAQNNREIQTNKEISFLQAYGRDLNEARDYCKRYKMSDKKNTRKSN